MFELLLILGFIFALACGAICVLIYRWLWPAKKVDPFLVDLDSLDEDSIGFVTTRVQRKLAYAFQAKFGELRYNKANRIIAGDWVRAEMAAMEMRNVDIVRHMAVTIELCLTPSSSAVVAAQIAQRRAVRERRAAIDSPK
jgi:hypothetical protein